MRTKTRFRRLRLSGKEELRCILVYFSLTLTPDQRYPAPPGTTLLVPGESPDVPWKAVTPVMVVPGPNGVQFRMYISRRLLVGRLEFVFECNGDFSSSFAGLLGISSRTTAPEPEA